MTFFFQTPSEWAFVSIARPLLLPMNQKKNKLFGFTHVTWFNTENVAIYFEQYKQSHFEAIKK